MAVGRYEKDVFSISNIADVEKQDFDFEELADDICIGLYGVSLHDSIEILDVINRKTKELIGSYVSHPMFEDGISIKATERQIAINIVRRFEKLYRKITPDNIFLVDKSKVVVYNSSSAKKVK